MSRVAPAGVVDIPSAMREVLWYEVPYKSLLFCLQKPLPRRELSGSSGSEQVNGLLGTGI